MIQSKLNDSNTLKEVKAELREHWEDGIECPACTQNVKLYARTIHSTMAKLLIRLYLLDKKKSDYYHVRDIYSNKGGNGSNDFAKYRMWEMIEQKPKDKKQKGRTSGYWKITEKGKAFVRGELLIPERVMVFNKKAYRFTGENISISDALGIKFDYTELMKG